MGCGKSKHDVVTGNTTRIKKPSEAESVKGKESETIKRQESCRCRKTNDISAVVSGDQPETNVETNSKKPKEKEDGGDCSEAVAVEMTNGDKQPEEKETTTTFPPVAEVAAIVPENVVTEETVNDVNENESVSPVEEQKEVEEPIPEVQTQVTTELEVQDIPTTENDEIAATENDDIMATENDEIPVLKDEDKVDVVEENPADITKVVESA
ncbi:unnamed protein product [Arabidopsis arenosa]|uniref:Uncharacterized protein n=1 Tax=Arabidopsis arenosa TaxID=38785 RepID=A0A8S2AXA8_ARAAE|nr:unnamed protein product [Arabidopsis arenosa]